MKIIGSESFPQEDGKILRDSSMISFIRKNPLFTKVLFYITMLTTCMVIGDGILTPAISILSSIEGVKTFSPNFGQGPIIFIVLVLLLGVFIMQPYGTKPIRFLFSPIIITWLLLTPSIGIYNILMNYPTIFKGVSPHYLLKFFINHGSTGWIVVGGATLCITGVESMFADLGHFNKSSIQLGFLLLVYPSNITTYAGIAAYLIRNPHHHHQAFYNSTPKAVFWPMLIISTLASIVASHGLILASFSLIKQCMELDCFPRVQVVSTSTKHQGQIYLPQVNIALAVLCTIIVLCSHNGNTVGSSYGIAVLLVMLTTTFLLTIVMVGIWRVRSPLGVSFLTFFGLIEMCNLVAVLSKVPQGGWITFLFALIMALFMFGWVEARTRIFEFEISHSISFGRFKQMLYKDEISRVPSICFIHTLSFYPTKYPRISIKAAGCTEKSQNSQQSSSKDTETDDDIFKCATIEEANESTSAQKQYIVDKSALEDIKIYDHRNSTSIQQHNHHSFTNEQSITNDACMPNYCSNVPRNDHHKVPHIEIVVSGYDDQQNIKNKESSIHQYVSDCDGLYSIVKEVIRDDNKFCPESQGVYINEPLHGVQTNPVTFLNLSHTSENSSEGKLKHYTNGTTDTLVRHHDCISLSPTKQETCSEDFENDFLVPIPPILQHYVRITHSLHQVVVLTCFKIGQAPAASEVSRFHLTSLDQINPTGIYLCTIHLESIESFQSQCKGIIMEILTHLQEFIQKHAMTSYKDGIKDTSHLNGSMAEIVMNRNAWQEQIEQIQRARQQSVDLVSHMVCKPKFQLSSKHNLINRSILVGLYPILQSCDPLSSILSCMPCIKSSNLIEINMAYEI
ncbi:hypothetical protein KP509_13G030600 [Ceratopteris richardii]|uniref:K+ potassium transporter integral membrane domain-containing protein n=1 Tax=Ceratopteris richardii TaxID=49495 RepID=A0A8T2TCJ0_CERRI|nr:hypothetical protein KP509_13G030600 [Ceratopteris richardii]